MEDVLGIAGKSALLGYFGLRNYDVVHSIGAASSFHLAGNCIFTTQLDVQSDCRSSAIFVRNFYEHMRILL